MSNCENCSCASPGLRKDGFTKIFQKPLNAKQMKHMENAKRKSGKLKTALETVNGSSQKDHSDDDDDSDH